MSRTVHCIKLGIDAEGLDRAPLPGALGARIFEQVSKQAWKDWIAHQTRLINEYRLVLAEAKSRKFLMDEMERYFFGDGQVAQTGYVPPAN
ncbi:oxidative damage protection protein [Sinimarinibacterium sp. CAU 1509]|uniref:oxidative damage protection protein n=1 Tax=Sinimarinibacterium sp. CAU 1509 TaxID=2562283 RepID=UPI0010AD7FE1|nr:oxidative damage protection protein [Sinimarinibacterium sp. CAU 1509]TJY63220.1 oxidative damage protection protein [Sinimarinibacterium sp. CAU 1509]